MPFLHKESTWYSCVLIALKIKYGHFCPIWLLEIKLAVCSPQVPGESWQQGSTSVYLIDSTSVYLFDSSLQNLAVLQSLHSSPSVPVERSFRPCIRWCWTGGFQEKGQYFFLDQSCSIIFRLLLFYISLHSVCWLDLWGWGLWTDRV